MVIVGLLKFLVEFGLDYGAFLVDIDEGKVKCFGLLKERKGIRHETKKCRRNFGKKRRKISNFPP